MTGALVKGFVIWKTYELLLESRNLLWPLDRKAEDDDNDDDGDDDDDGDGDEDGEDWICWQSDWTADPAIALHQQLTSLTCRLDDDHDSGAGQTHV